MNLLDAYLECTEGESGRSILRFLRENGIYTVERLLAMDERQLEKVSGWSGTDSKFLKTWLAQQCSTPACTLSELHDHSTYFQYRVSTGSNSLDLLLGGGFFSEEITEISGPSGSGKTQICLAAIADLLCKNLSVSAAYIDTGNSFNARRFKEICESRTENAMTAEDAMRRLRVWKAFDVAQLGEALVQVAAGDKPLRILVVDSVTAVFAPIVGGKSGGLAAILRTVQMLRVIAARSGVAVVLTNSTVGGVGGTTKPALGLTWSHVPSTRVLVEKDGRTEEATTIHARLSKSPRRPVHGPQAQVVALRISTKGLEL